MRPGGFAVIRRRDAFLKRAIAIGMPAISLLLAGCSDPLIKPTRETAASSAPLYEALTEDDIQLANQTLRKALETALSDTTFTWRNTRTGHAGTVTPQSTYKARSGYWCRVYRETITIGSRTELYEETSCRDRDDVWRPAR